MPPLMLLRHLGVKSVVRIAKLFRRPRTDDAA
jgi:hypothetical protein